MTITTTVLPNLYSPVAAEIWFGADSTSSTISDFKYIFTINKVVGSASTTLGTYKEPPRPSVGYGLMSPHKLLRSEMSFDLNPFTSSVANAPNSIVEFNANIGFSYDPSKEFQDIVVYPFNPNAILVVGSASTFDVIPGDILDIALDNLSINPYLNGNATVVDVITDVDIITGAITLYIELNKTWSSFGTYIPTGVIIQQTRTNFLQTDNYWAYNGTRQYDQIETDFTDVYVFRNDNVPKYALTNYKNIQASYSGIYPVYGDISDANYTSVFIDNFETLSFIFDDLVDEEHINKILITQYRADKTIVGSNFVPVNGSFKRFDIPVGPRNLIEAGLISDVDATIGSYYMVSVIKGTGMSERVKMVRYYKIVDGCSPYNKNWRLSFLNNNGGQSYWNFNWKWTNSTSVNKTDFKRQLPYNYTVGMRSDSTLSTKAKESYTISSSWVSQNDYNFLKELITSPQVYLISEGYDKQYKLPITITNTTWNLKTTIDNKLFSASVDFEMAYDINLYNN